VGAAVSVILVCFDVFLFLLEEGVCVRDCRVWGCVKLV
jgi:hypothetical protein